MNIKYQPVQDYAVQDHHDPHYNGRMYRWIYWSPESVQPPEDHFSIQNTPKPGLTMICWYCMKYISKCYNVTHIAPIWLSYMDLILKTF